MRHLALAAAALGALAAPALANVIRVPQDHATIQAAVNAALPGDKIIVGPGAYAENVQVIGKSNILIRGRGLVTVNPPGGVAIGVVNSNRIRIKGLSTATPGSTGIVYLVSPDGLVAKCRMQGLTGFGAAGSDGLRVVACKVSSTSLGIGFGGAGEHTAERCRVTSAAAGQAILAGGDTVNLIRCKVSYTGVPGQSPIELSPAVRGYVERCRVQTAPTLGPVFGIDLQPGAPAAQLELVRNRIEGGRFGIAGPSVNNVTCFGNFVAGTAFGGLGFNGINLNLTRNKILLGAGTAFGIFTQNATNVTISRNKVSSTGAGVFMQGGSGNTISSNRFKNLTVGVTVTGTGHTIGPDNRYKNVTTPISDGGTGTIILDSP